MTSKVGLDKPERALNGTLLWEMQNMRLHNISHNNSVLKKKSIDFISLKSGAALRESRNGCLIEKAIEDTPLELATKRR